MEDLKIYSHDSDLELLYKSNRMELESWLKYLGIIATEIENILQIIIGMLSNKSLLYQKIVDKKLENRAQLNAYFKYENELKHRKECQDMDCERYYVAQHEEFRRLYNSNLEKYHKIKEGFFQLIKSNYKEKLKY